MYHVGLVYTKMKKKTKEELKKDPHGAIQMNETVKAIEAALKYNGHKVTLIPASINMLQDIANIGDIDVIFNACTGIRNKKEQANVIAMLELLDIPFVGSSLSTQIIGLHKSVAKRLFKSVGVPTANFQVFYTGKEELDRSLRFPLIVKPENEGSSLGITADSIVFNEEELYQRVRYTISEFKQIALVEEFVTGREFTIGVIGNANPQVLPIMEIIYEKKNGEGIQSLEIKAIDEVDKEYPANLSKEKTEELKEYALRAYKALGCTEYARIDVRMDEEENPFFIELNTLPGMQPNYSDFPIVAKAGGYDYNKLIEKMLQEAIRGSKKKVKKNVVPMGYDINKNVI